MKRSRLIISNPFFASFLSFAIFLISCKDEISSENQAYSGQELFQGVFFGQGPVVERLSTLQSYTKIGSLVDNGNAIGEEVAIAQDAILSTMEKIDPDFFNDFKKKIQSGSHVLIQEAIENGAFKFRLAVKEISGLTSQEMRELTNGLVSKYDLMDGKGKVSKENISHAVSELQKGQGSGFGRTQDDCVELVVVLALALVLVVFINTAVAVELSVAAIDTDVIVRESSTVSVKGSLFADQLVNDIATNLK